MEGMARVGARTSSSFWGRPVVNPPDKPASVLQQSDFFAALKDFVGRAPWPAADPLVGLLGRRKCRTSSVGQPILAAAVFSGGFLGLCTRCVRPPEKAAAARIGCPTSCGTYAS